jgi:RNA-binding protein
LDSAERKALKARAHSLDPVVLIGDKGVTDQVVAEIDLALKAHELIKVRAASLDRHAREEALEQIVQKTGAAAVQHIGKVLVLYRRRED